MDCLIVTSPAGLLHHAGPHHPERPERLQAVLEALAQPPFDQIPRRRAPKAERHHLVRVHDEGYVDRLLASVPADGRVSLDPDTWLCPDSGDAALEASGAVVAAVDAVLRGDYKRVFCAVRPPGHHAESDRAMGFCLFNSVAVGAAHALAAHGLQRVCIVDFDVHHGNGTAEIFADQPAVLYVSTHQMPLYPGTGESEETGAGNLAHAPLPAGADSAMFRAIYEDVLLPRIDQFAPQLLLVSAGFDGHADDPLANMNLQVADYRWITDRLVALAEKHCEGRLVSALEGGYDLVALGKCSQAHVSALCGM